MCGWMIACARACVCLHWRIDRRFLPSHPQFITQASTHKDTKVTVDEANVAAELVVLGLVTVGSVAETPVTAMLRSAKAVFSDAKKLSGLANTDSTELVIVSDDTDPVSVTLVSTLIPPDCLSVTAVMDSILTCDGSTPKMLAKFSM
mmetsp:Transcript_5109/g.7252  ORF Transcript_5109/g.7252 Transcript_5109/m.7252 type:complete len:147 (-) Transcript_5109:325-765(-)